MKKTSEQFEEVIDVDPVDAEIVKTPELAVTYNAATIEDNLAELEAYVDHELQYYVGAVIDPNDAKQVKAGRTAASALNKLKEPIETERKRIKREYEKPLKAFEARVKEITSKIDAARADIKKQVDDADAAFKDARRARLEEEYEGAVGPMADVIGFDAILDPAWLRRSTNETKAINDMVDRAIEAKDGYETLMAKELHHKDEVVHKYATTLDVIAALKLEDELNTRDQELADFKAKQETMARMTNPEPVPEPEPEPKPELPTDEPAMEWELNLKFTGPKALAIELAHLIKSLGITGGRIHCIGEAK